MKKVMYQKCAMYVCMAAFLIWAEILLFKYDNFGYYDWDLAFFTQAFWSLAHGSQFVPLVGINYFGNHSYFISLFVLPLFYIFPHPLTLIFVKLCAFIASGMVLYRLIEEDVGSLYALLLLAAFLFYPANAFSLLYDFNVECFAGLCILLMVYFYKKGHLPGFLWSAFFLCMIKENMPLVLIAFGLYAMVFPNGKISRRAGLGFIIAGAIIFALFTFVLVPYFLGGPHVFWERYSYMSQGGAGHLAAILFSQQNAKFVLDLFGPLLIPSLLSPHLLFLVSPILMQHFLSSHYPEHTIFYHYGVTLTPLIFLAAASTFRRVREICRPLVSGLVILIFAAASFVHIYKFSDEVRNRVAWNADQFTSARWDMVKSIPRDAGVIASFNFLAELSLRKSLYSFHMVYDDFYQDPAKMIYCELYNGQRFVPPPEVTYALIDFDDAWLQGELSTNHAKVKERILTFLQGWTPVKRAGHVVLYQRKPMAGSAEGGREHAAQ